MSDNRAWWWHQGFAWPYLSAGSGLNPYEIIKINKDTMQYVEGDEIAEQLWAIREDLA